MRIAFFGDHRGMTAFQRRVVVGILKEHQNKIKAVYHTDQIGADEEFQEIAEELNLVTVVYPQINAATRAYCQADAIMDSKIIGSAIKNILENCDFFIGVPGSDDIEGWTWYAINAAFDLYLPTQVVLPNNHFSANERLLDETDEYV